MGSFFFLPGDFVEREIDSLANKSVSQLAKYLYYTSKNITLEAAMEIDKLGLDERYNRVLKAS